jgi:hypothetical protein
MKTKGTVICAVLYTYKGNKLGEKDAQHNCSGFTLHCLFHIPHMYVLISGNIYFSIY